MVGEQSLFPQIARVSEFVELLDAIDLRRLSLVCNAPEFRQRSRERCAEMAKHLGPHFAKLKPSATLATKLKRISTGVYWVAEHGTEETLRYLLRTELREDGACPDGVCPGESFRDRLLDLERSKSGVVIVHHVDRDGVSAFIYTAILKNRSVREKRKMAEMMMKWAYAHPDYNRHPLHHNHRIKIPLGDSTCLEIGNSALVCLAVEADAESYLVALRLPFANDRGNWYVNNLINLVRVLRRNSGHILDSEKKLNVLEHAREALNASRWCVH